MSARQAILGLSKLVRRIDAPRPIMFDCGGLNVVPLMAITFRRSRYNIVT